MLYAASLAVFGFMQLAAQQPVLVPAGQIPDPVAYTALFFVVGHGGEKHWDHMAREKWLTERGFDQLEASRIMGAASSFRIAHAKTESELAQINRDNRQNPLSDAAKQQRMQHLQRAQQLVQTSVADLDRQLGPAGSVKLRQLIAQMKLDIKMKAK